MHTNTLDHPHAFVHLFLCFVHSNSMPLSFHGKLEWCTLLSVTTLADDFKIAIATCAAPHTRSFAQKNESTVLTVVVVVVAVFFLSLSFLSLCAFSI